ncbi:hypothetical protein FGB62_16g244 [Gracilaria domingensis]|nr:hypothetical protein FGB62_16g244 [Gracilaria domingensis]
MVTRTGVRCWAMDTGAGTPLSEREREWRNGLQLVGRLFRGGVRRAMVRGGILHGVDEAGGHTVGGKRSVGVDEEGEMDGWLGPNQAVMVRIAHDVASSGAVGMNGKLSTSASADVDKTLATMDWHAGDEDAGEQPPATHETLRKREEGGGGGGASDAVVEMALRGHTPNVRIGHEAVGGGAHLRQSGQLGRGEARENVQDNVARKGKKRKAWRRSASTKSTHLGQAVGGG